MLISQLRCYSTVSGVLLSLLFCWWWCPRVRLHPGNTERLFCYQDKGIQEQCGTRKCVGWEMPVHQLGFTINGAYSKFQQDYKHCASSYAGWNKNTRRTLLNSKVHSNVVVSMHRRRETLQTTAIC